MCLPGTVEAVREQIQSEGGPRIDRRSVLLGGVGAAVAATFPASARAGRPAKKRVQDLTHVFGESFPVFDPEFSPARRTVGTIPEIGFYVQEWTFSEHSCTHLDPPGHVVIGGRLVPEITPQELIVPLVVIDISERAARDADTVVTVDDLTRFERRYGQIPDGSLVCMNSGWAAKVGNPLDFKGGASFPNYHFPGFSSDASTWVAEQRDAAGIGVDTLSLDSGNALTFPVHATFLPTDRYGIENLNNLDKVPPRGALAYVGVIPWEQGSGGPCRVIASW